MLTARPSCELTEELFDILSLTPGLIGIHPNDNTATVCLKTADLADIISEHGNSVEFYKPAAE